MAAAARLDLRTLLSACVHLARRGGSIIRDVHQQGQLGAHNKKIDGDERAAQAMDPAEVLTVADMRSQDAIVRSLRGMFPGIRLVGEEEETQASLQEVATPFAEVLPLADAFEVPAELAESLTMTDTCLWVDPLDGTIEFVRGNLQHVCVLIGIAVRDRPVAGVVLEPFVGGEQGRVTYGAVGVGVFGDQSPAFGDPPSEFVPAMESKHAEVPRIKAAVGRLGDSAAAPRITQGAGQNLLKVLRGETSAFVQEAGASRWDSCAGEALLMAVGGKVTDLDGRPYAYTEGAPSYINAGGLIAARTGELHARMAAAFTAGSTGSGRLG
mmetsp:Transcript_96484/g.268130  ORF Transcript_96484/g.268130 Transcript_96484/m.268130 type:complete len:325 (+) Transcript_96484:64-1038(+)